MNISTVLNIFLSVFSGILTAGFLYIVGHYFDSVFIPWYRGIRYKGLDISGEWSEIHNYEDLMIQESKVTIKQTAEKIEGEIILAKKNNSTGNVVEMKLFKFKGEFLNNFLNITCWNSDQKQIGTHNYLLKATSDGREMKGMKTYFDIGFQQIRTDEIYWTRKEKTEKNKFN